MYHIKNLNLYQQDYILTYINKSLCMSSVELTKEILKNLIAYESVSPSDGGAVEYVSSLLQKNGFSVIIKEFGSGKDKTKNIYAYRGNQGDNLLFSGHLDVVPPGDISLWTSDPFKMIQKGEKLYGRGAVDMKSSIAAMLASLINYSGEGKVSILLTSDEEIGGHNGAKQFLEYLEKQGHKFGYAIIGEPTSENDIGDTIKIGRRGSITFKLKIIGKQGHIAYPELADNPATKIINILHELVNMEIDKGNEYFPSSNLEVTTIDIANKADNIIPASAYAEFNIRFNNLKTSSELAENVEKIIQKYAVKYKLDKVASAEPFLSSKHIFTEQFRKIVSKICNTNPRMKTNGGTSDARFINNYVPIVEFGPLGKTAHQIDEHTEISHLQKLYTVYYESVKSYHNSTL